MPHPSTGYDPTDGDNATGHGSPDARRAELGSPSATNASRRGRTAGPRLGLVCITFSEQCRFRTITRSRFLSLPRNRRRATLEELYWANLGRLHGALSFCQREGIRLYRATSELFPMSDEPLAIEVLSGMSASLASRLRSPGRPPFLTAPTGLK